MSIRHLLATADTALLEGVGLAAPATGEVPGGIIGSGRTGANVALLVGLISVVLGGLAIARAAGRIGIGSGRRGAIVAAAVGLIGMVLAGLHLATSSGGFGTGNGRAGAIVALGIGLIGIVLGRLALARSRRTADRLTR